jgi:zinc protease
MNLSEGTAGIERLALSVAVNGGTQSTPKDEFNARLDAVGSSIGHISDRDFSGITMNSVRDHFDETWELFEEAIFEPAFTEDEVELRRNRQLADIESLADNPDALVGEVARDLAFSGHPYEIRELGTLETVSTFTQNELKAWHYWLLAPERIVLVVVGNIDQADLVAKVQSRLGRIPSTGLAVPDFPPVEHDAPALRVESMNLPTNYILGYFTAPSMSHDDYAALVLATRHLRSRLFEEIRTRRNLTYAVSSGLGNRSTNVGFLYVTAVDPAATMPVMFAEVERLKNEPLTEQELQEVRNVFLTSHYMGLETNSSVAGQIAQAELIGGDWSLMYRFLDAVNAVTAEDIQRVAQTYLRNTQFGVVGNPDDVPASLFGVDDGQPLDQREAPAAHSLPFADPDVADADPGESALVLTE